MRAALLTELGSSPSVQDFEDPEPVDGAVLIDVTTAGLGAWDILAGAALALPLNYPCVVRGEGVGHTPDGRRVYFGERSVGRFGAWAQRTVVPSDEVWDVPDDIDDALAITLAIAGTGALVPLEQADIQTGENVLILGATGALGQVALQLARHLGAGRVVAAGRDQAALDRLTQRGIADAVARIGTGEDVATLKAASGDGFDVVLDVVYGDPFLAALKATAFGARIMSIGAQAGMTANVPLPDMLFRTHTCVGTGQRPPADRRAIWERLLQIARDEQITVDYARYTLDQAADAWAAQAASPHAKVIAAIASD
jgi:NADPH:quinone reductase-like Zn-dependent oxidoreductase